MFGKKCRWVTIASTTLTVILVFTSAHCDLAWDSAMPLDCEPPWEYPASDRLNGFGQDVLRILWLASGAPDKGRAARIFPSFACNRSRPAVNSSPLVVRRCGPAKIKVAQTRREDDPLGWLLNGTVQDMDVLLKKITKTKQQFYCMVNRTPADFQDKSFKKDSCFAEDLQSRFSERQPTCAFVSHSRDFLEFAERYSFQEEIDRHDIVVRFNLAKMQDGKYGCKTNYRVLNNQFWQGGMKNEYVKYWNRTFKVPSGELHATDGYIMFYNNFVKTCSERRQVDGA